MLDAIGTQLAAFAKEHTVLSLLILAIGSLDYIQWLFGKFVRFTHQMRLHYRKLKSEPDPQLVHD